MGLQQWSVVDYTRRVKALPAPNPGATLQPVLPEQGQQMALWDPVATMHPVLPACEQAMVDNLVASGAFKADGRSLAPMDMEQFTVPALSQLKNLGIVSVDADDFGSSQVALHIHRVKVDSQLLVGSPIIDLAGEPRVVKNCEGLCKLELVHKLLHMGWLASCKLISNHRADYGLGIISACARRLSLERISVISWFPRGR